MKEFVESLLKSFLAVILTLILFIILYSIAIFFNWDLWKFLILTSLYVLCRNEVDKLINYLKEE